jgi:aminopeptidase N
MPRAPHLALALAALVALAACGGGHASSEPAPRAPSSTPAPAPAPDPLSEASLAADLVWLTAPERAGRGSTTAEARATARWIAGELRAAGYAPIEQPIPDTPGQVNVIAELAPPAAPGASPAAPAPAVIVIAHYDHLGVIRGAIHPGADDNASGVAVALAVARDLRRRPIPGQPGQPGQPGRPGQPGHARSSAASAGPGAPPPGRVIWLFSGAEELGLRGARAFAAAPPLPLLLGDVRAVYNLDMVGRELLVDGAPALIAVGLPGDPDVSEAAHDAAAQTGLTLIPVRPGLLWATRQAHRSDDWVFRDAGVHAVHFSTGPHDDYHSPGDTADKVSQPQALRVARFLRALVERTAR